jgi:site-specific DNA-methyltransferase (adenine-specific)
MNEKTITIPGQPGAVALDVPSWRIDQGEALQLLRGIPDESVEAIVTDPPYSSGGQFRGDRAASTGKKYVQTGTQIKRLDFQGDNRDQRSFTLWATLWLLECYRAAKPGAPIAVFTDWRQLPAVTDALQAAGFIWRGVAVWDKTEGTRPQMGRYRAQAEYIVWGTKGPTSAEVDKSVGVLPGVFRHSVRQSDKWHQTGKPTLLMKDVARICPPGGLVLDPFVGSGTTVVGALLSGRRGLGFEMSPDYAGMARIRCEAAARGEVLDVSPANGNCKSK